MLIIFFCSSVNHSSVILKKCEQLTTKNENQFPLFQRVRVSNAITLNYMCGVLEWNVQQAQTTTLWRRGFNEMRLSDWVYLCTIKCLCINTAEPATSYKFKISTLTTFCKKRKQNRTKKEQTLDFTQYKTCKWSTWQYLVLLHWQQLLWWWRWRHCTANGRPMWPIRCGGVGEERIWPDSNSGKVTRRVE